MATGSSDSLTIVVIPDRNDKVWEVSSEKVPHITILHFDSGVDESFVQHVNEVVGHAAKSVYRGMVSVDYRDVLGEDEADVLFLKNDFSMKHIRLFRHFLLQDNRIRERFLSTTQYPEWTPHLTLGYPKTPAKPIDEFHNFSWVSFDKIAVWDEDYSGTSYLLNDTYEEDVAMSEKVEKFIAHHGVKGMKWGVRRDREITVTRTRNGNLKTSGGHDRPASSDAKKTAVSVQKARKSNVSSLSNKELEAAVKRMQLEQQFTKLTPPKGVLAKASKFMKDFKTTGDSVQGAYTTGKQLEKAIKAARS